MLKGYWRVLYLAVGLASPVFGQQDTSGVSSERPSIEEYQSSQSQGDEGAPSYPPIRVTIEESPEGAAHTAERERKSDEHEASDLSAQWAAAEAAQRSAASTERQEIPAWVQLLLAIIGTVIAVAAIISSVVTAVRQGDTARKQLRAYLQVELGSVTWLSENEVRITIGERNVGQTPAYRVSPLGRVKGIEGHKLSDEDTAAIITSMEREAVTRQELTIGAGIAMSYNASAKDDSGTRITAAREGRDTLIFVGRVEYEDIFGKPHTTWFFHTHLWTGAEWKSSYHRSGNHAD